MVDWDQLDNGLLGITMGAGEISYYRLLAGGGCAEATVTFSEQDRLGKETVPLDEAYTALVLQSLEKHPLVEQKLIIDYDNLWELGWRLGEFIPMPVDQTAAAGSRRPLGADRCH